MAQWSAMRTSLGRMVCPLEWICRSIRIMRLCKSFMTNGGLICNRAIRARAQCWHGRPVRPHHRASCCGSPINGSLIKKATRFFGDLFWATFFACIFLSASIDGYVRYARRALHLAPIHPPAASGSADAPPRTAYGALLRDHNRQLVAALTSMNSAPSAGATPNQAPAYVLPLPGLFYLRVIATEHAEPLLQQGLRDVAAYMARQVEGAPASLNVSFDICMASATYAPTLELAQSVRLTSGSKEPGLVAECAVWGANRPLCPRRPIGPRSLLTSGRR